MEIEISLKALIKNNQKQYLFLKRSKPYPKETECKWDVPGGRLIPGEKISEALAREIKEETQMKMKGEPRIIDVQDILRVEGMHTIRLAFEVEAEGRIVLNAAEHTEYRWLAIKEALKLYHDIYLTPVLEKLEKSQTL